MSFFSMPQGYYRIKTEKNKQAFTPKSMIDTLFDYRAFLGENNHKQGSIAIKPPSQTKKVAIIGAGAAGLVAAYELAKIKNIEVTLYEASDRLGGRMDSIRIDDGEFNDKIFEMGCMRFPPTSHTLYHYLDQFGLKPVPNFPDPGVVNTKLLYKNKIIEWPAGENVPDNEDFQRIGRDFTNMLNEILGSASSPNINKPKKLFDFWAIYQNHMSPTNKKAVINAWQLIINQYSTKTYYEAVFELGQNPELVEKPWTDEDMNKFGALGVGSGGFGPLYSVNFVEILRLFANGWEDNQELLLSGIISLVDAFNEAISDKVTIRMNAKVNKIQRLKNQYQLLVNEADNTTKTHCFDAVIVATTTRAMEYMGLTLDGIKPATQGDHESSPQINNKSSIITSILNAAPKEAIRNLHLMNSSKYFVTTKTKFWYAANNPSNLDLPFNIQTDESLRGLYCLNYDADLTSQSNDPNYQAEPNIKGKGVILISYVWGDDSSKLLALSEAERFQQFLSTIKAINSSFADLLAEQVETTQVIDWENTPNYYGAFKLNYPGQEQDNHAGFFQYQSENEGVFLAGDSISWAGGWLEGAMPTGVNAACAAASYVGATIADNSPLTAISSDMFIYNNAPSTGNKVNSYNERNTNSKQDFKQDKVI